jgi:hypothetical protein
MARELLYWEDYGRWRKVYSSAWIRVSVPVTALLWPIWSDPGWWDPVLAVTPNLIGYALGGFAIFLGSGTDRFRELLSGKTKDGKASPLRTVAATFCHFVVVSTIALGAAVVCKAYYVVPPDWVFDLLGPIADYLVWLAYPAWAAGWLLFIYSLSLVVATANNLVRYTGWLDTFLEGEKQRREQEQRRSSEDSVRARCGRKALIRHRSRRPGQHL